MTAIIVNGVEISQGLYGPEFVIPLPDGKKITGAIDLAELQREGCVQFVVDTPDGDDVHVLRVYGTGKAAFSRGGLPDA